jgi:cytochrome c oxidase assembly protein subunit 15
LQSLGIVEISMSSRQIWTHRLAFALVVITLLLPVLMGSLTTTLGAGMAFLDWPTSDGKNMLFYNMLHDIRVGNTDKVAEHGHRLAGMIVGLMSIPLAILGWNDGRRGVRALTLGVFIGVLAQGLLGGARVLLDARTLAMLHSFAAALIVALMALAAAVTSSRWSRLEAVQARPSTGLWVISAVLPLFVLLQYVAGGFVRHFGLAIPEHLGGALIIAVLALATAMLAVQNGIRELRPFAWGVFAAVTLQIVLGFGAWAGKFGLAALGIVAVERGVLQVTLRTMHTAGGMTLLLAAVLLAAAIWKLRRATARDLASAIERDDISTDETQRLAARPHRLMPAGGVR